LTANSIAKIFTRKSDFVAQSDAIKKNLVLMKLTHIANVSHDRHTEVPCRVK
jgi:hypothetical protein